MALLDKMVKIAIIIFLPVFLIIPQKANSYSIGNTLIPETYIDGIQPNSTNHISLTTSFDACNTKIALKNRDSIEMNPSFFRR